MGSNFVVDGYETAYLSYSAGSPEFYCAWIDIHAKHAHKWSETALYLAQHGYVSMTKLAIQESENALRECNAARNSLRLLTASV